MGDTCTDVAGDSHDHGVRTGRDGLDVAESGTCVTAGGVDRRDTVGEIKGYGAGDRAEGEGVAVGDEGVDDWALRRALWTRGHAAYDDAADCTRDYKRHAAVASVGPAQFDAVYANLVQGRRFSKPVPLSFITAVLVFIQSHDPAPQPIRCNPQPHHLISNHSVSTAKHSPKPQIHGWKKEGLWEPPPSEPQFIPVRRDSNSDNDGNLILREVVDKSFE
ncbi:hypothetical protein HK100_009291, partial [Physocladia obscura]